MASDRILLDSGEDDPQRPPSPLPAQSEAPPASESQAEQESSGEPAPPPEEPSEAQRRLDRLTREKYEAQRQRDEYAAMLQQAHRQQQYQPQQQQPADPVEAARAEGYQQAHEQQVAARFNEACNGLFQRGQEEFGDMPDAVSALNAVGYGNRPDILAALTRLPDGHRVYRHLATDLDNAARLLQLDPMDMALELARLSQGGTRGQAAPAAAPVTRTPAPLRPVGGNASPAKKRLDQMSMAEFIRERDRTERRSRITR